jgi:hypothetical protein
MQQMAAQALIGHLAESNNKSLETVGGSHSPRRGGTLGNSPSNGGLTNKFSKYSIQERMRKYKSDFEAKQAASQQKHHMPQVRKLDLAKV